MVVMIAHLVRDGLSERVLVWVELRPRRTAPRKPARSTSAGSSRA